MLIRYLARRAAQALVVLFLLLTLLFFTARLTGDPITFLVGGFLTKADIDKLRTAYGLNQPLPQQYLLFLWHALHLDFGQSIRTHQTALPLILHKAVVSAQIVLPALALAVLISIPLGTLAAMRRGRFTDATTMGFAVLGQSVPSFFLAIVLIFIFGVQLHWLPVFGSGDLRHMILPVVTLMGYPLARYTRLIRAQVSETMSLDYVRTARAKGLSERRVVTTHVLKNSLLPVVSLLGVDLGLLISAGVIVEAIFAWPGFGSLLLQSAVARDYPVIQASGFLVGATVLVSAVLVDLVYGFLDPRMRLGA
jgi:peptide/nickel transport system permease protein